MHDDFIGTDDLLDKHRQQVSEFERWAAQGDWRRFHSSHYDWWAFPIAQPSRSWGHAYAVPWEAVQQLRDDPEFLASLERALTLLAASWGWDLQAEHPLPEPTTDQAWAHWPIRLKKATVSARLFDLVQPCRSLLALAQRLEDGDQLRRYRTFFERMRFSLRQDGLL